MDKLFEALDKLLRTCLEYFGVNITLLLIFLIPIGLFLLRVYKDWAKRTEVDKTIAAKDETIQMLAEQNRQLRVIELRSLGWSEEAIDKIVMKNTPRNALEAREMLEKDEKAIAAERSKRQTPRKSSK